MNDYKEFLDNGIYDIQAGKFEDAIEKINKSLELKKDWEIPYFYRAVAYQALENFDEAILDYTKALEYLDRAIELEPDFIHAKALKKLILSKYIK